MTRLDELEKIHRQGGWYRFPKRTLLKLTGEDRLRFLNGQCTQKLQDLQVGQTRYACAVTAKGRLSGDFHVRISESALWLDAEDGLAESLMERLDRYIIADDVELADVSEEYALYHWVAPMQVNASETAILSQSDRVGREGTDCLVPTDSTAEQETRLDEAGFRISDALWDLLRLTAGYARWGRELTETTLPPEALLEARAISYDKGCYTGQEVISRIRSIGRVNQTLVGLKGPAGLKGGEALQTAEGKAAGFVTSWIDLDESHGLGLAYRKRTADDAAELLVSNSDQTTLAICPLPFACSLRNSEQESSS